MKTAFVSVLAAVAVFCGFCGWLVADRFAQPRILVTMTSKEKPIFASAQILRLMNQDYRNFKVSVSVKGMDDRDGYDLFRFEWMPFVQEGRLRVTRDKDKTPLENWADTVLLEDLNTYDIVCFVKDENWYAPDYLKTVADAFDPERTAFLAVSPFLTARRSPNAVLTDETHAVHGAGNVCVSAETARALLAFVRRPQEMKDFLPPALRAHAGDMPPTEIAWRHALKRNKAFVLTPSRPLMIDDTNIPVFSSY